MSRDLSQFLPVPGDGSAAVDRFLEDPGSWLPEARHAGQDRWLVPVAGGPLRRTVEVTVGDPWQVDHTWWRRWSWRPVPDVGDVVALDRLLPVLDGELGVTVTGGGQVTVVFDGRYVPPGGPLGEAIDVVALGRVARRTIDRVLADVAVNLAAPAASAEASSAAC